MEKELESGSYAVKTAGEEERAARIRMSQMTELKNERVLYEQKKNFFDEGRHVLGVPYICSGFRFRTPENGRLDYALIEMNDNRIANNVVPSKAAWNFAAIAPPAAVCDATMYGMASCKDMVQSTVMPRTLVYKIGARTGATTGQFNSIKSDVRMGWDANLKMPYSSEYVFIGIKLSVISPTPGNFVLPGDSGSMVFDNYGRWVGLVHGGPKKHNTINQFFAYITDTQAILDDMTKRMVSKPAKFALATD